MFGLNLRHKSHKFDRITEISNIIQQDDMGYPLVLCIAQCNCGATEQWVDVSEKVLEDPQYTKIVWRKILN